MKWQPLLACLVLVQERLAHSNEKEIELVRKNKI